MQIAPGPLHLTYCTNIHPADGWDAVFDNLREFAPALKQSLAPAAPFGIGLRLSAREAQELLHGNQLAEFHSFLESHGLYVAIINGFPYGFFHGAPVKETVYAPDWREEARVEYTLNLGRILKVLLPDGIDGGISTAPLSYKPWNAEWEPMARNVARVAEAFAQIHSETGKFIHLDIEPEPDCVIENTAEAIDFFERSQIRKDHVQICFDCCHFAVEYEDPLAALGQLKKAGIRIGRIQLSSALKLTPPADAEKLRPFAESTYLHQTIANCGGTLHRFADLDDALAAAPTACEWRTHFHVPLFLAEYAATPAAGEAGLRPPAPGPRPPAPVLGPQPPTPNPQPLRSTQAYVRTVIEAAQLEDITHHLEIETYTWDVLPGELKINLLESIRREYEWVLSCTRQP